MTPSPEKPPLDLYAARDAPPAIGASSFRRLIRACSIERTAAPDRTLLGGVNMRGIAAGILRESGTAG